MTVSVPIGRRRKVPEFSAAEFFELGQDESASPFLTPFARRISKNFSLKASILSAFLLGVSYWLSFGPNSAYFAYLLLVATYLIVGAPALIHSIEDILMRFDVNIDVLMTLAAFSSLLIGTGYEGALLLVLFALSGAIEDAVTLKAKSSLITLHSLVPMKAYVQEGDQFLERSVKDVQVGTIILVRAGEVVPLDGVIIEGRSFANFAHLTGESKPIRKEAGDEIASGARVVDSSLLIQVTHKVQDSTVSKIVRLITKAQSAKPKLEKTFDRFGRVYAISIISFSFLVATCFPFLFGISLLGNEGSLYRALAFLITASPCALILAVPIAYLSTLGACAKKGVVMKGGVVVDALNSCSIIAFDKTGTLTMGELVFDACIDYSKTKVHSEEMLLSYAAALERNAVHPVAKAIVERAKKTKATVQDVQVIPGYGVRGKIQIAGSTVEAFIGDVGYVAEYLAPETGALMIRDANRAKGKGKIVAGFCIGQDGYLFSFSDHPRPEIANTLSRLKKMGYRLLMLTGDSAQNAAIIAKVVGISEFQADLKPEDKLETIEALSKESGLAMCGDGINDAPALKRASVGIAMGQVSSATARAAADVILLHDTIEHLDWLFIKAQKTKKIVLQNLVIALLAIVGGSIPALYGVLPLWLAVIVHEGGTVLVGLNAIRLLK